MQVVWFWISRGQKSWCLWNSKSFPSRKFNFNRKFITSKLELFGIDWWIKHLPSFFFLLLLFPIDGQMSWQARSLWQFHTYFNCELITLFIYNTYSQRVDPPPTWITLLSKTVWHFSMCICLKLMEPHCFQSNPIGLSPNDWSSEFILVKKPKNGNLKWS